MLGVSQFYWIDSEKTSNSRWGGGFVYTVTTHLLFHQQVAPHRWHFTVPHKHDITSSWTVADVVCIVKLGCLGGGQKMLVLFFGNMPTDCFPHRSTYWSKMSDTTKTLVYSQRGKFRILNSRETRQKEDEDEQKEGRHDINIHTFRKTTIK